MNTGEPTKSRLKGIIQLGAAGLLLWGITVYGAPALINAIPMWKSIGEASDRLDINAGSIYYTDVPISGEAELYLRSTIKYRLGKQ